MAIIRKIATALPPYRYTQAELKEFAAHHFRTAGLDLETLLPVFDRAGISERHLCVPLTWYAERRGYGELSRVYCEAALNLATEAAARCLAAVRQNDPEYGDPDMLVVVSTTGLATPTLDAHLLQRLRLSEHTRRLPIWGLGCAGGVAGLARSMELLASGRVQRLLLVVVETCSLTFQPEDLSKANLVATAIFGDGAAAVLLEVEDSAFQGGVRLLNSFSTTWPDSAHIMGWDFTDRGMQLVFSPEIPEIVRSRMRQNIELALQRFGVRWTELRHWVLHPGGLKVLRAYEESLGLSQGELTLSWEALKQHGNLSSASVLFVLERFLAQAAWDKGELGIMSALGPGFSAEHLLFAGL